MVLQYEADIIEKGISLSWTTWGKMHGETLHLGDISYLKSDNGRGFERIFSISLDVPDPTPAIDQMIAYIKAGLLPDSILLGPGTRPPNLAELLSDKGFRIDRSGSCMLLELAEYTVLPCNPFVVVKVEDISQLAVWLQIVNDALFGCELVSLAQFEDIFMLGNTHFYLGMLDQQAVTACLTITQDDTSVLEMVATLKEHRRKGLARAVIDRAMVDLRIQGIKTISLRAETDGIGLYKVMGFEEYCVREVAFCDWEQAYQKTCPCHMEQDKIDTAQQIFAQSSDIQSFVDQMQSRQVIGRQIWYTPEEHAIYIQKMYACDCGGGCPDNPSLIGQRCHCDFINHTTQSLPISYCNCAATFFAPMFTPIFGDGIKIEPVATVLSGAETCIFKISLPQ